MKPAFSPILAWALLLALALFPLPGTLPAQDQIPAAKLPPVPVPAAVMRAAVRSERLIPGKAEDGQDLILQRIEKPVYTPEEAAAEAAARLPLPPPAPLRKAAMLKARQAALAKAPAQILLFSPRVTEYGAGPEHLSLVEWWTADAVTGYAEAAAWVRGPDIAGTIQAIGDLEVPLPGTSRTRRWLVMPAAGAKPDPRQTVPAAAEFQAGDSAPGTAAVLMEKGQPTPAAMEPLQALLAVYSDPVRSAKITADAATLRAAQDTAAREAAWAAAHPQKPRPAVVKFYTSDADETEALAPKPAAVPAQAPK